MRVRPSPSHRSQHILVHILTSLSRHTRNFHWVSLTLTVKSSVMDSFVFIFIRFSASIFAGKHICKMAIVESHTYTGWSLKTSFHNPTFQSLYTVCIQFISSIGALAGIAFSYSLLPYYPPTSIFSKYYPQTSENQFLEEALTGLCAIAIP